MLARKANGTVLYTDTAVTSGSLYKCACHSFKQNPIQIMKETKINIDHLTPFSKETVLLFYTSFLQTYNHLLFPKRVLANIKAKRITKLLKSWKDPYVWTTLHDSKSPQYLIKLSGKRYCYFKYITLIPWLVFTLLG